MSHRLLNELAMHCSTHAPWDEYPIKHRMLDTVVVLPRDNHSKHAAQKLNATATAKSTQFYATKPPLTTNNNKNNNGIFIPFAIAAFHSV